VTEVVSEERWAVAQAAEGEYWRAVSADEREFLRLIAEKAEAARWFLAVSPDRDVRLGKLLELGVGPLGVGCIHFLQTSESSGLTTVEPLSVIPSGELRFSEPLRGFVEACRTATTKHIRAGAEEVPVDSSEFNLVVCYNVLDHVQDAARVLQEVRRVSAPNSQFFLAVDTQSDLSIFRFRWWIKRRKPHNLGVRAHTYRLRERDVRKLLRATGFRLIALKTRRLWRIRDVVGHAHRFTAVCEVD
jgi:SAM-dependent methyltransferase